MLNIILYGESSSNLWLSAMSPSLSCQSSEIYHTLS